MNIPRRKLNEVMIRYKLEPGLDDVYVEGRSDKQLLDKAFKELKINRPVYEIDTVDITDEVLEKYGFTRGEKQEVIALCGELNIDDISDIRFLVDADMDKHLNTLLEKNGLVYTKYCDLEGAFLSNDMVRELVCDAGGVNCKDWDETFESVEETVKSIFALRLALKELGHATAFPSISKSLVKTGQTVSVDIVNLALRANVHPLPQSDVEKKAGEKHSAFAGLEARQAGRGHDYIQVVEWLIKKLNGNKGIAESLDKLLILLAPRVANNLVEPLM